MPTQVYRTKDQKKVPGTTTVIGTSLGWNKNQLMHWAHQQGMDGKDFRKTTESAALAGTVAHGFAEAHIKKTEYHYPLPIEPDVLNKAKAAFEAFLVWEHMSKLELLESEIPYVSEIHRYGGTIDAIGKVNGKIALIDFKTSSGIYGDHLVQVAAYRHLYEENHEGTTLDGGVHILRFGKEGGDFHHHYYPREAIMSVMPAFLHLRALYDLKKEIEKLT
jgi:hypothetical protein